MGLNDVIPRPAQVRVTGGRMIAPTEPAVTLRGDLGAEEYCLTVEKEGVRIEAGGDGGVFYARQTLRQLAEADGSLRCCEIRDAPRFAYRGFHLDSARHMQTVDELKRYIDAAALLKLNVFHWHLTDDQGWRFACDAYPRLTEIGSRRKSSDFGKVHTGEPYGGYYTKDELRDVAAYCAERNICVVPEFDVPGHSTAAIAAYPHLSCSGAPIEVETRQGVFPNLLCAGKQTTYDFVFAVLDELCDVFPGPYIHIGGDEAPKGAWNRCPDCRKEREALGLTDSEQLQGAFTNRVVAYLREKGRTAIVWNEALKSGMLDRGAVVQNWMDRDKLCPAWAHDGGKVIVSEYFHYYLDYPYAMTPLNKTLTYDPLKGLDARGAQNVLGVEAPLWTENIDNFAALCAMGFPRLAAAAETAWARTPRRPKDFQGALRALVPLLRETGVEPAPEKAWNPSPLVRPGKTLRHFLRTVDRDTVKNFLFHTNEK